jgi:hypothetical protein
VHLESQKLEQLEARMDEIADRVAQRGQALRARGPAPMKPSAFRIERLLANVEAEVERRGRAGTSFILTRSLQRGAPAHLRPRQGRELPARNYRPAWVTLSCYDPSTPLASSCHSRANQSQNFFIMKSLLSFARSSQARAFARQYSGFNTPAVFSSL